MTIHKLEHQIESLEERLKRLKAQKVRVAARKRSIDTRRDRRDDTRRKILVGAIVLAKVEQGAMDQATLFGWLDAALTREDDRALFELDIAETPSAAEEEKTGPVA